jgi:hypothetical protein
MNAASDAVACLSTSFLSLSWFDLSAVWTSRPSWRMVSADILAAFMTSVTRHTHDAVCGEKG